MSDLNPAAGWPNIDGIDEDEELLGGVNGPLNRAVTQLTARTNQLQIDSQQSSEEISILSNDLAAVSSELGTAAFTSASDYATAAQGGMIEPLAEQVADIAIKVEGIEDGQSSSALYFPTKSQMDATSGTFENQGAFVTGDPGSGQYRWTGSSWEFLRADYLASKADKSTVDQIIDTGVIGILSDDNYTSDLQVFTAPDAQGKERILGRFREGGVFDAVLSASVDGLLPLAGGYVSVTEDYGDDIEVLIAPGSPHPRVIRRTLVDGSVIDYGDSASDSGVRQEVIDARGTTDSLSARLAATIRADGLSPDPYFNGFALSETRRLLQGLRTSDVNAAPFVISTITDSWGDNRNYWLQAFSVQLKSRFGNAGVGFMPVDRGGPDTLSGTLTRSGDWAIANHTGPGPGLISATSSTAGSSFTVSGATGGTASICFAGGAGVVRYRYDAGAWTTVNLDGAGVRYAALGTPPSGTWTLVVEVVSGECTVYGFDVRASVRGVRINKLGAGGSRLSEWTSQDLAQWRAGFEPLGSNLVLILFGTNDAYFYSAEAYGGYARQLIARVRTANPFADILLVSPPQNLGTATVSQFAQAYVLREVAADLRCAHLDLQQYFGNAVSAYDGSARDYINSSDPSHPTVKGGALITEIMGRLFNQD